MNKFYSKKNLRNSGLTFSLIFFIVFFLLPYLLHAKISTIVFVFSLIIASLSILSPYSLSKPYKYWITFGEKMSQINSALILGIFFYIIITPVALIKGILSKLKMKSEINSYFEKPKVVVQNFEDQI